MNLYELVLWPESQEYMEEPWFQEEAVLDNSENAESSSYFIPIERIGDKNTFLISQGMNSEKAEKSRAMSSGQYISNLISELRSSYNL